MRMRVGFNCSNFSMETCVREQLERYLPAQRFKNLAARTTYGNYTGTGGQVLGQKGLCAFYFPEAAGPNNRQGWGASAPSGSMNNDWRSAAGPRRPGAHRARTAARASNTRRACSRPAAPPGLSGAAVI